jgi:hypothetical protein
LDIRIPSFPQGPLGKIFYLKSADEHRTGRVWWRYYGLELSEPILEALYHGIAKRILNWEKA